MPEPPSIPTLPEEFERRIERAGSLQAREYLTGVHALGFASFDALASALPDLEGDALVSAIWALPYFDRRRTLPLLRRLARHPTPLIRDYSLVALEMIGGASTVPIFLRSLHEDPDPEVREQAAHGLGFLFDSRYDDQVFEPLLAALENEEEAVGVRAQAAESLGNILGYADRRTRRFKRAQAALLRALDHPDPAPRFWAAFALGKMRSRAALPRLREMAEHDTVVCPLWWTVAEEASDAIHCILTGGWPDHERVMHR